MALTNPSIYLVISRGLFSFFALSISSFLFIPSFFMIDLTLRY